MKATAGVGPPGFFGFFCLTRDPYSGEQTGTSLRGSWGHTPHIGVDLALSVSLCLVLTSEEGLQVPLEVTKNLG
jgi:hypothetical protein